MYQYHIMEYLDPGCDYPQGYACLEKKEFEKWKKHPHKGEVKAFAVVTGMENCAEWGKISCKRLWDYQAVTDTLPDEGNAVSDWEIEHIHRIAEGALDDDEEAYIKEATKNLTAIFGEDGMKELFGED